MMQTWATVSINGAEPVQATFSMDTAQIDVSTAGHSKPDQAWEFVDAAGHFHAFDHEGELPTLIRREHAAEVEDTDEPTDIAADDDDWDEFGDSYPVTKLHCLLCDAEVEPHWNYVSTPFPQYAAGRTDYRLTLHSPIPEGRFSVVVTVGDKVWFGIAEGRWTGAVGDHDGRVDTYEAWCGPMSWRKRTVVPAQ